MRLGVGNEIDAEIAARSFTDPDSSATKIATLIFERTEQNFSLQDRGSNVPGIGDWIEQLIAESTGKDQKGRLPIVVESEKSKVSGQALSIGFGNGASDLNVMASLGEHFILWEWVTALLCRALEVDPFNQPNVTEAKERTGNLLEQWDKQGREDAQPSFKVDSMAIYGGANVAWQENQRGKVIAQSLNIEVDPRISALAFVPATELSTSKARKMLPESIPHHDAVRNSINTAVLVQALQHRPDLLLAATEDYLHQSYRSEAMPQSFALMTKLRKAGVAAFISGAGPTVLVLHTGGDAEAAELERAAGEKFQMIPLGVSRTGVAVVTA